MFVLLIALALGGEIKDLIKRCDALNTTTIHIEDEFDDLLERVVDLEYSVSAIKEQIYDLKRSTEYSIDDLKEQIHTTIIVLTVLYAIAIAVLILYMHIMARFLHEIKKKLFYLAYSKYFSLFPSS